YHHFAFLQFESSQPHAFSRQKAGNLVEQFHRVNVRVDGPLHVTPAVSRALNGADGRPIGFQRTLQLPDLNTLPPDVTCQGSKQTEVHDQRARQQTPHVITTPLAEVQKLDLGRQQARTVRR